MYNAVILNVQLSEDQILNAPLRSIFQLTLKDKFQTLRVNLSNSLTMDRSLCSF